MWQAEALKEEGVQMACDYCVATAKTFRVDYF
jgi:hypothetical protein